VIGEFDALDPGSRVRLEVAKREREQGWQATSVRPVSKHQRPETPDRARLARVVAIGAAESRQSGEVLTTARN
jgi:hypothetical protein